MADDIGKKEEEKIDFTPAGEDFRDISLDQARLAVMRTTRETPGAYGSRCGGVSMASDIAAPEGDEEH